MAGACPGPMCRSRQTIHVNDGTLCRIASPRPRPLGAAAARVASWSVRRKLLEAARRTTPKLPLGIRQQFASLLSGANLAITGGVLTAWGASHFIGIGEAADAILLVVGVATVGWQAVQAASDLGEFLRKAVNAQSEEDLDEAASHLARAVVTIGVTAFAALIMKFGRKAGGAVVEDEFFGANVARWLDKLGNSKAPPLVRERFSTTLKFFQERFGAKNASEIEGYLKGIDFSKDVKLTVLEPGAEVVAFGDPARLGMYYTKAGTGMDRLGIATPGRTFMRFRVKSKITVLESKATGMADTWTTDTKVLAGGGGLQYIVPDAATTLQRL